MLLSDFGELVFEKVLGFKSRKMSLFFVFIEMPVIYLELLKFDLNLKVLVVIIDINLNFKCHIKSIYKETDQELNAL